MDAMNWPLFAGLTVALCSTFSDAQTKPNVPPAKQMALVTFFSNPVDMWGSLRGHHSENSRASYLWAKTNSRTCMVADS